jgi:hypothetical protein
MELKEQQNAVARRTIRIIISSDNPPTATTSKMSEGKEKAQGD